MKTSEIIDGLEDLIHDRKSFTTPANDKFYGKDNPFRYDIKVLQAAIDKLRRAELENKALITVEQVQEFYEFLQGNIPYNDAQKITFTKPPKVSKETATDIIYYLQEVAHIIPDTYESCKKCGDFLDSDNGGCLAGFCECCGCQHPEFVEQEDGCIKCEESLYARKPEGSAP